MEKGQLELVREVEATSGQYQTLHTRWAEDSTGLGLRTQCQPDCPSPSVTSGTCSFLCPICKMIPCSE